MHQTSSNYTWLGFKLLLAFFFSRFTRFSGSFFLSSRFFTSIVGPIGNIPTDGPRGICIIGLGGTTNIGGICMPGIIRGIGMPGIIRGIIRGIPLETNIGGGTPRDGGTIIGLGICCCCCWPTGIIPSLVNNAFKLPLSLFSEDFCALLLLLDNLAFCNNCVKPSLAAGATPFF